MKFRTMRVLSTITLVLAAAWLSPSVGQAVAVKHTLTCGPKTSIGEALGKLKPGDTLKVSGTCNENVNIGVEVAGITLDGQGTATINGAASDDTVTVAGRGITIQGFTITGGQHGISVQDGAFALIDGNTIQNTGKNGIVVFRSSTARIINNVIQFNPSGGINVGHSSSALIGFTGPPGLRVSAPNTIQNNGGSGVQVVRGSSAQIFSNTIQDNRGNGVLVDRNAQVEVSSCIITGNLGDGVRVMRNGGIDFGTDATGATATFDDDTNTGTNGGYGVSCTLDGFMDGKLGTLTGTLGRKTSGEDCTDSMAL
jgi:parallel beta-helix repeat protein